MLDILIGLGLTFLMLRLAERMPRRVPVPIRAADSRGARDAR
jgi:hypothetical protein